MNVPLKIALVSVFLVVVACSTLGCEGLQFTEKLNDDGSVTTTATTDSGSFDITTRPNEGQGPTEESDIPWHMILTGASILLANQTKAVPIGTFVKRAFS